MPDSLESEMRAPLVLGAEAVEAILRAATTALPREACGVLVGSRTHVVRAREGPNVARDPTCAFDLDPGFVVATEDDARRDGLELLGIWHTHPNAPAELSAADRRADIPGRFSLVVSFEGGEVHELRAWGRANGEWVPARVEGVSRTRRAPESRATRAR